MNSEEHIKSAYKILVIDDNPLVRELLRRMLQAFGEVTCAGKLDAGVHLAHAKQPQLIVLDYDLPGENGITGIRCFLDQYPQILVALLAGNAATEPRPAASPVEDGVRFEKPQDIKALLDLVMGHAWGQSKHST